MSCGKTKVLSVRPPFTGLRRPIWGPDIVGVFFSRDKTGGGGGGVKTFGSFILSILSSFSGGIVRYCGDPDVGNGGSVDEPNSKPDG